MSTLSRFCLFKSSNCYSLYTVQYRLFCAIEEWKEIPGFPNYHASTLGNIKNVKSNKILCINYDKFLTSGVRPRVTLSEKGHRRNHLVGRAILLTFRPIHHHKKLQANHIDGDPNNNKLCNLEWTTPKENMQHSYKIGTGNSHKTSVILRNMNSKSQHTFESIAECCRYIQQNTSIKCCQSSISNFCKLKSIRNGYLFSYTDDKMYLFNVKDMVNEKWKLCHVNQRQWQYFASNIG
eukprot:212744_1